MIRTVARSIVGPRVPPGELERRTIRYGTPGFLLLCARVLILVSLLLPYWHMELYAPQYPDNLKLHAYLNKLEGDVAEINALNHYIGMRPLQEAAQFERAIGVFVLIGFVVLLELAAYIHTRWAALLVIPTIFFPAVFLLDLHLWMSHFGQNLDPDAPLSHSIKPFVPPIMGTGVIGQFKTVASPGIGLLMATGSSVLLLLALFFHRRAYLPLVRGEIREEGTDRP